MDIFSKFFQKENEPRREIKIVFYTNTKPILI